MAGRLRRRIRVRISRRAAGVPDPDDAAEPEILPAARPVEEAAQQVPDRLQHAGRRSQAHRRRQRPCRAPAPVGCPLLLQPGSQGDAGFPPGKARQRRVPQQDRFGTATRRTPRDAGRQDRRQTRRQRFARRPRGAPGQGRPHYRHGRRVSRTARHHGPLLRPARRRGQRGRRRRAESLSAALRRRRTAGRQHRLRRSPRRQARCAGRLLRYRPDSNRRQGPVRPAPRCARRAAHPDGNAAAARSGRPDRRCASRLRFGHPDATRHRAAARLHARPFARSAQGRWPCPGRDRSRTGPTPDTHRSRAAEARRSARLPRFAGSAGFGRRQQAYRQHPEEG